MEKNRKTTGFTILETLVVVAVIMILVSMVIALASRFEDRGKERVIKSTFAMLDAALGEFAEYGYEYKYPNYDGLKFPLDCNSFGEEEFEEEVEEALELGIDDVEIAGGYDPNYSGSAWLYFFLSQVPECREALDRIDISLVTNEDTNGNKLRIGIRVDDNFDWQPLNRIIDPWGRTIRYSYYDNGEEDPTNEPDINNPRTFPLLISAGPDGQFGTTDDIKSNE